MLQLFQRISDPPELRQKSATVCPRNSESKGRKLTALGPSPHPPILAPAETHFSESTSTGLPHVALLGLLLHSPTGLDGRVLRPTTDALARPSAPSYSRFAKRRAQRFPLPRTHDAAPSLLLASPPAFARACHRCSSATPRFCAPDRRALASSSLCAPTCAPVPERSALQADLSFLAPRTSLNFGPPPRPTYSLFVGPEMFFEIPPDCLANQGAESSDPSGFTGTGHFIISIAAMALGAPEVGKTGRLQPPKRLSWLPRNGGYNEKRHTEACPTPECAP